MNANQQILSNPAPESFIASNTLECIRDAFFVLNADWCFMYVNNKAAQRFGKKQNDLIGKNIWKEFPGEIGEPFKKACQQAYETQNPITLEDFNAKKNCWLEYHIYPSKDGLSIIIQDITQRKQSELALRESERQYRWIISASDEGIWILNKRFYTSYVNNRLADMLGHQAEDMIGHRVEDFLLPEDWKDHKRRMKNRKSGMSERYERRFQCKDGHVLWAIISATPIIDENGSFQGSFAMFTDITDRKQAEETLAEREQLLSAMSRMAKIGAWEFDPVTLKGTWTDETARIHDLDPKDETNVEKGLSFYRDDSRQKIEAAVKDAIEQGMPYDLELELVSAKGKHKWVHTIGKPKIKSEQVVKVQGIFQDITEHKAAAEAVQISNLFLNSIIDQSPYAMWVSDAKGNLIRINPACCRMLNITPDEVIGKYNVLKDNIVKEQNLLPLVKSVYTEGKTVRFEIRYDTTQLKTLQLKNTAFVILDTTIFPIEDQNGKITNAVIQHINITDRKQAEEALRKSEENYRFLFENNPHPMWVYDLKTLAFLAVNDAAVEKYGYTRQEFLSMTLADIRPAEDVPRLLEDVAQERPTLQHSGEWRHRLKDGRIIDVEITSHTFSFDGHNSVLVIAQDITERKVAQEALRQSEFKFRKFVEESSVGIMLIDEQGRIVEWNRAVEDLSGIARDEVIYEPCWDVRWRLIPLEQRTAMALNEIKSQTREALRTGEAPFLNQPNEETILHAGGDLRDVLQTVFPIKINNGFWLGVLLRDITQSKRAEENLRQSEDKFSKAFQASPNIIVINRLSDGKIIEVNDVFITRSEYTREEILGHIPQEFNLWVDQEDLDRYMATLLGNQNVREMEARFQTKSGQILNCLVYGDIITLNNEPCILSTILDITDRKRQEEQIERQLQRLAALRTIDLAISSSFDLRITLAILLEHITTQLHVDAATVLTLNPYMNTLEFAAQRGFFGSGITQLRLHMGQGYAGKAALERRLISIPDLTQAEHQLTKPDLTTDEGFGAYFAVPLIVKGQIKGVLEVLHRAPLYPDPEWLDFLETIAGQAAIAIDNAELFQGLQRSNAELILAYDATIEGWSAALDLRDKETEGHSQRVLALTLRIARIMGITDEEMVHVRRGALLHDIGKLGVPDNILLKPGPLSDEEWEIMHKHPNLAYEMLSPITHLRPALDIPYCHHEKWDGTGYPRGLKGEQIPLSARIFALVDVWDALRSDRPYRPAWTKEATLDYIQKQSGRHFDPDVVNTFFNLLPSIEE